MHIGEGLGKWVLCGLGFLPWNAEVWNFDLVLLEFGLKSNLIMDDYELWWWWWLNLFWISDAYQRGLGQVGQAWPWIFLSRWTFGPPSAIVGTNLSQFFAWDVHILTHMSRHVSALVCLCPLRLILGTPECRRCPMAPNSFCHISIKTFSTFPHGLPAHPFVICICLIWYSPGHTVKSQQLCRILLLCMCPS